MILRVSQSRTRFLLGRNGTDSRGEKGDRERRGRRGERLEHIWLWRPPYLLRCLLDTELHVHILANNSRDWRESKARIACLAELWRTGRLKRPQGTRRSPASPVRVIALSGPPLPILLCVSPSLLIVWRADVSILTHSACNAELFADCETKGAVRTLLARIRGDIAQRMLHVSWISKNGIVWYGTTGRVRAVASMS